MGERAQMTDGVGGETGRPFVHARGLGLSTPRVRGYADVDLDLEAGRAYALCAENRSGKTELLLTLAGRMRPNAGTLSVGSANARSLRGVASIRRASGLAFFDNVNEVERALRLITITSAELSLAGRPASSADAARYLVQWGLGDLARLHVADLPRFDYDRLGIALGMCADPRILAVHDVERDLTEHQSLKLVGLLRELARERGVCVVCGVTDYDVAARFDEAVCLTDDARAQRDAYLRRRGGRRPRAA